MSFAVWVGRLVRAQIAHVDVQIAVAVDVRSGGRVSEVDGLRQMRSRVGVAVRSAQQKAVLGARERRSIEAMVWRGSVTCVTAPVMTALVCSVNPPWPSPSITRRGVG
jgi:hypothetical protein